MGYKGNYPTAYPLEASQLVDGIISYAKLANDAKPTQLMTPTSTTGGTSIDITSIPTGTRRVTVAFAGLSWSGTAVTMLQLGDAGGVENTGYLCAGGDLVPTANFANQTAGFVSQGASFSAGTEVIHGYFDLVLVDSSTFTWICSSQLAISSSANIAAGSGSKSLSAELDRIRLTTVAGTATVDALTKLNVVYAR